MEDERSHGSGPFLHPWPPLRATRTHEESWRLMTHTEQRQSDLTAFFHTGEAGAARRNSGVWSISGFCDLPGNFLHKRQTQSLTSYITICCKRTKFLYNEYPVARASLILWTGITEAQTGHSCGVNATSTLFSPQPTHNPVTRAFLFYSSLLPHL